MSKLKVGQILGSAFGALVVLLIVISTVSVTRLSALDNHVENIGKDRVPKLVVLDKWMVALLQSSRHMRNILIYDKEKVADEIASIRKRAETQREGFAYFDQHSKSESSRKALTALAEIRDRYIAAEDEVIKLAEAGNFTELRRVLIERTRPLQVAYIAELQKLIDHQVESAGKEMELADKTYNRGFTVITAVSLLAVLAAIILAFVITRHITGQLGGEPAYVVEVAQAIADGDLTGKIETRAGDHGSLLHAMHDMQASLKNLIGQTLKISEALVSAAHSLAASSRQVAYGSEQQSEAASSMAAAVEQLTVSISHVADSANGAHTLAAEAGKCSNQGALLVQDTVDEINQIASSVEHTAHEVQLLGEQSEKISGIVKVIKDIAGQTNLLALNAAIEAARAGDQGRGFAVVADEVRKLAERTTASTKEIADMISAIQHGTEVAVSGMDESRAQVTEGVEMANRSGESMHQIETGSDTLLDAVEDISSALKEQSGASNQIALNVEKIAQMTEENSVAINSVSESATQLEQLATELQQNVGRFRV